MNRREFLDKLNEKILSSQIGAQCTPVGLEPEDYKEFIEHITPLYKELYGGLITADFEFENVIYSGRIVFMAPNE